MTASFTDTKRHNVTKVTPTTGLGDFYTSYIKFYLFNQSIYLSAHLKNHTGSAVHSKKKKVDQTHAKNKTKICHNSKLESKNVFSKVKCWRDPTYQRHQWLETSHRRTIE